MLARSIGVGAFVGACFSPKPPTGVPCEADADCPAAQVCHAVTHTCELTCEGCSGDAGTDALTTGDGPADCWSLWLAGTLDFDPPVQLTQLASPGIGVQNPSVTADGLGLYFDRGQDLFRASRSTPLADFGSPVRIEELATTESESRITTTADDQLAVFGSARVGTTGLLDLWQVTRGADGTFGPPDPTPFGTINDANNQFDPELAPDGLDLYWAPAALGIQQLHHARRASTNDPFKDPEVIALSLPDHALFFDPSISPDQRVLVISTKTFASAPDLAFAVRSSPNAPFGPVQLLTGLNTTQQDSDGELAADGCTVYFSSNREQALPGIWAATLRR